MSNDILSLNGGKTMRLLSKCTLACTSILCLAACGGNSVARKGYEMYKRDIEAQLIDASHGRATIAWRGCYYIYFNDKNYSILDRSCWYCINSTIIYDGSSIDCTDYITYTDGQGTYSYIEAKDYQNAVSVYSAGKIKGESGNLN